LPPANEEGGTGNDCQPVMDMEDLLKMGTEHKVCPFYYTRSQVEKAELILVPYNYLFDKDAKESTLQGIDWKNSVVIFDEGECTFACYCRL
jgi:regulator of telomere elongation helicase 1